MRYWVGFFICSLPQTQAAATVERSSHLGGRQKVTLKVIKAENVNKANHTSQPPKVIGLAGWSGAGKTTCVS